MVYMDTSALVKLVVAEPETPALIRWLGDADRRPVACDLVRTELLRAVRRTDPDLSVRARAVLNLVTTVEVGTSVFEQAGRLDSPTVRSLDAIHLASALSFSDELEALVTYDNRLADAARANGVETVAPR
ncbi:MAG TPA: PIN domain-containing protein [Acidimicrobiales bacterium]|nr:PIN domain-containing protein [Acidimicrobiales bacterium]